MATDFAYMTSGKNLKAIMARIQDAGSPPKFTLDFLRNLGFTSSTDRPVIGVLKGLGFLSSDGVPTERYNAFRNSSQGGAAIAAGLRDGWSAVFLADQSAHQRTSAQLADLFKSVSGKSEAVAKKMATTFKTLCDLADWTTELGQSETDTIAGIPPLDNSVAVEDRNNDVGRPTAGLALHHDVHLHLPATSDVSVYTAIFRALKAELLE